jgi:hypothetical protein
MRSQPISDRQPLGPAIDLFDYLPRPALRVPTRRRLGKPAPQAVVDDWPSAIPVSSVELDCLEAHFRRFLDELLGSPDH